MGERGRASAVDETFLHHFLHLLILFDQAYPLRQGLEARAKAHSSGTGRCRHPRPCALCRQSVVKSVVADLFLTSKNAWCPRGHQTFI